MDRVELIRTRLLKRKRRLEWEYEKKQAEIEGAKRRALTQKAIAEKVPSKQSYGFTVYPRKKPRSWQ